VYLQIGNVLALHKRSISGEVVVLGEAAHCKDEVGVRAEVDVAVGIKEGGPRGGGVRPGVNKGQQNGWRADMHGNRCGRERRCGGSWGWDLRVSHPAMTCILFAAKRRVGGRRKRVGDLFL